MIFAKTHRRKLDLRRYYLCNDSFHHRRYLNLCTCHWCRGTGKDSRHRILDLHRFHLYSHQIHHTPRVLEHMYRHHTWIHPVDKWALFNLILIKSFSGKRNRVKKSDNIISFFLSFFFSSSSSSSSSFSSSLGCQSNKSLFSFFRQFLWSIFIPALKALL